MNKTDIRNFYLKQLYNNAGKNIKDEVYRFSKHYINYNHLNSIIISVSNCKDKSTYVLNDTFGSFFDMLCRKIINELYCYDTLIIVLDCQFNNNIVCQLYNTDNNLSFINVFLHMNVCKDNVLYSRNCYEKSEKVNKIALDFFKKAYENN